MVLFCSPGNILAFNGSLHLSDVMEGRSLKDPDTAVTDPGFP